VRHLITLDIGTSSMRAIIYADDGSLLMGSGYEYHTTFPAPGQVEQDPQTWLDSAVHVLGDASEYAKKNKLQIEAIAVTSQRSSLIPVGPDGKHISNAMMWQDKRTIKECERLGDDYGLPTLYRKTGLRINPYFVLPKIMWLKGNRPEVYNAASKLVGVQDYVVSFLTGEFKTDWSQACRTMLMNIKTFSWDSDLLSIADVDQERLPKLLPPGSIAGGLLEPIAKKVGLKTGLPVILCGGDQQNAAVALNVIRPGYAEANTGTGSFVIAYSSKPAFDKQCRVLCQASAVAGKWILEAGIFNTGSIYRWFKEQFYPELKGNESPYPSMNAEAANSAVGANGVIMIPHFEGSAAPYWNPLAKGLFFNLGLNTKRGDLARAIQEGIGMEISDNLDLIEQMIGEFEEVSVAGGMVRSDLFCQMQAAIYNKKVARYQNSEATSLGAAMIAWVTLGVHSDIEDAFGKMITDKPRVFTPVAEDVLKYDKLQSRKQKLYNALNKAGVYESFAKSV